MTFKQHSLRIYLQIATTILCIGFQINSNAQLLDTKINIDLDSGNLNSRLLQLQHATGFSFAYETSGMRALLVKKKSFKNEELHIVLRYLLDGTGYTFEENNRVIIIGLRRKVNHIHQFTGVIEDKETGDRLAGVAFYDPKHAHISTLSDQNGNFTLSANSDTLRLQLHYLSYRPVEIVLRAVDAPVIRIKMDKDVKNLDSTLVVTPSDITSFSSLNKLSPSIINLSFLPRFFGNLDLMTLTKFTPGIQETNDGSGDLVVRGGAPDQNLLLLDDATIYGSTHLFGMFSSANAATIKNINIYKGGFPAHYGGRISSIWDISIKNGDLAHLRGSLSVGTMATDLLLEGPIVKNKTSFLISGRKSYHDYYVRLFHPDIVLNFQDLTIKLHHRFSNKDQLSFTAYSSRDIFKYCKTLDSVNVEPPDAPPIYSTVFQSIQYKIKNNTAVLNWRHYHSWDLVSNFSILYSDYGLFIGDRNATTYNDPFFPTDLTLNEKNDVRSGLHDLTGKFDIKYTANNRHLVKAGIYYTNHSFDPHNFKYDLNLSDSLFTQQIYKYDTAIISPTANEVGFFAEDNISVSSRLRTSVGLHLNKYFFPKGSFFSFQPRVNIIYRLGNKWTINASYVRMQQVLHRLSISPTSLPVDFWIPSNETIKPQLSDQVSCGISGKLFYNMIDFSLESYYKGMKNVPEYLITGFNRNPQTNKPSWNDKVTIGTGKAYGIEFSISKSKGKLRSWFSYSLSWSNRLLPEVNNGASFPYKYDRRHGLNAVNTYKLGKFEMTSVFSFQSRLKPPVPIIKSTDFSDKAELIRTGVASSRQYAYHRLDLGVNLPVKYGERINAIWNLSVLNIYNRENSFFYFSDKGSNQLSGTTLLPVTASLSCMLNF